MKALTKETGAGQIHILENGSGFPLVAVHGVLSSALSFESLLGAVDDRRVIAFDLPGHGESVPSSSFEPGWKNYADVVDQVADAMGLKEFDLLGHSMGGGIAAYFAATRKKRVRRLILCDSVTKKFALPLKGKIPQVPILGEIIFSKLYDKEMFIDYFRFDVFHNPDRMDVERVLGYYASFDRNRPSVLKAIRATGNPRPVANKIKDIDVPTLVIWGENDPLIPMAVGADTHRELANSKFSVIPDCGHSPFEESPQQATRRTLEFLK